MGKRGIEMNAPMNEQQKRGVGEYKLALASNLDRWVPACGGMEVPFASRGGYRLLYVWNPKTGAHAYLDVDADRVLTDEEVATALLL